MGGSQRPSAAHRRVMMTDRRTGRGQLQQQQRWKGEHGEWMKEGDGEGERGRGQRDKKGCKGWPREREQTVHVRGNPKCAKSLVGAGTIIWIQHTFAIGKLPPFGIWDSFRGMGPDVSAGPSGGSSSFVSDVPTDRATDRRQPLPSAAKGWISYLGIASFLQLITF